MKNVVGSPARGENFFSREKEIMKIVERIENDNNIQIAAPRRVGKTSILFYMLDNVVEGYRYVYVDTESIETEEGYYKKILKELLKMPGIQSRIVKYLKAAGAVARKIKSLKIVDIEIDLQDDQEGISYYEDLVHLLSGIEPEENKKLILLIDEFPQTILNISNHQGTDAAIRFLQSNRTLRLNPDIVNKVRFIYTGSIGLNHTVAAIDSTAFINDLNTLEIEPLSRREAEAFLQLLLSNRKVTISPAARDHLFDKLQWLIPFHVQLLVQELLRQNLADGAIDVHHVDQAFEEVIATRNDNHFAHYHSRLRTQFKGAALNYATNMLAIMAEGGCISRAQLFDEAVRLNVEDQYKQIIEILVYDGYINNVGDKTIYRFNSPVLRLWWQKYISK